MSLFSEGNLDTRVGNLLKKRRDEFTEIGVEFDKMAESIQSMIQSKQQMLYNVSHELRSPLARQLMSLDILKISPSEEHETLLEEIKKENDLLNELISDILMLAKLSTKSFTFKPEKQDLNSVIEKAVSNINFEFQKAMILFKVQPEIIEKFDPKLIKLLVENLLRNAIKYSGFESTISLSAQKHNNNIIIEVIDQGPGISETHLPYIFEPFK